MINKIKGKIYQIFGSPNKKHLINWFNLNGDKTFRLDYPELNEKSIVFDCGGYEGQWTSDIYSKYRCKVYVFEPVKNFAENIKKRFSKNKNIRVYYFGLSNITKKAQISNDNDASSLYKGGKEVIQLKSISEFIIEDKINKIDLLKLNVEGEEYNILNNLISTGLIKKIKEIQVQFHRNIKNYKEEYSKTKVKLKETHKLKWRFPFIWEDWKK